MKKLTSLLVAALVALCGCDPIAQRQAVVEQFNTAEVQAVATGVYIVRDTNGAIWQVNAPGSAPSQLSKTKLFDAR